MNKDELMARLTPEQIEKFWGWCGLILNRWTLIWYIDSNTKADPQPVLDLNNLFRYALPKLQEKLGLVYINFDAPYHEEEIEDEWLATISSDYTGQMLEWRKMDKDPALALFWAIWEVIR